MCAHFNDLINPPKVRWTHCLSEEMWPVVLINILSSHAKPTLRGFSLTSHLNDLQFVSF